MSQAARKSERAQLGSGQNAQRCGREEREGGGGGEKKESPPPDPAVPYFLHSFPWRAFLETRATQASSRTK